MLPVKEVRKQDQKSKKVTERECRKKATNEAS